MRRAGQSGHHGGLKTAGHQPENLPALTGLRGLAALWVVSLHFQKEFNQLWPATESLNWFTGAGAQAVPVFFVLSGFILLHTYRDRFQIFHWRTYVGFLGLRLARIYPGYLAALLIMVGLVAASALAGVTYNAAAYPLGWLLPETLMLHAWVRLPPGFFGWNFPDWSVSAEWFAYLFAFPVALGLLRLLAATPRWLPLVLALALCWGEAAVRTEWKLPMVSLLFLAGACLWEWRRRELAAGGGLPRHLDLAGFLLLPAVLVVADPGPIFTNAGVLLAIALIIPGLSRADGWGTRLLATRGFIFLGEISYAVYLVHGIVQRLVKIALPVARYEHAAFVVRLALIMGEVAAVMVAATLLYRWVELPARRWLRQRFGESV
ncbi:MAG TPA: acyltransferase [Verrucomicrobiae bacterium]